MNFLKISSLVIGTGSVVGGTGAGIYYGVIKNTQEEKFDTKENKKTQFDGKLVFFKKSGNGDSAAYETKLLNDSEYSEKVTAFDNGKNEQEKHTVVNKFVIVSCQLNVQQARIILQEIFGIETTLENVKTKIKEKATELKSLFDETIYTKLESIS